MKVIKKYLWIIIVLAAAILIILLYPWTRKIDRTYHGMQCKMGDTANGDNIKVSVKGAYKHSFIGKNTDKFEGTIEIEGYDVTYNDASVVLYFDDGYAQLRYTTFKNGEMENTFLGLISFSSDLEQVLICVGKQTQEEDGVTTTWNPEDGIFIAAPAKDSKQAYKIADELLKQWNR